MLRNLDTIYYKPDLVRISQPKLISERTFFGSTEVTGFNCTDCCGICMNLKEWGTRSIYKSNRSAFGDPAIPNRVIHEMIVTTTSMDKLGNLMNPSKYYKLNTQSLILDRQPTIEFHQHLGTHNNISKTGFDSALPLITTPSGLGHLLLMMKYLKCSSSTW